MPRKKKGGNRGDSPEKFPYQFPGFDSGNSDVSQFGQGGGFAPQYTSIQSRSTEQQSSWVDVARQGMESSHNVQSMEQDKILLQLQEMFRGKVDPDVIYIVLNESNFKGTSIYQLSALFCH